MDRNWDLNYIEVEELKLRNEDPTKQAKCQIKSSHLALLSQEFKIEFKPIRTNIHNKKIIQFLSENFNENSKVILVAIHLCRRLSVRAIQLFNSTQNIYGFILAPCVTIKRRNNVRIGPIYNKTYNLWKDKSKHNNDINIEYLIKGITPYIVEENDNNDKDIHENKENEMKVNDDECCYHLTLMNNKQINGRNKKVINKFKLNQADIDKLTTCNNDYTQIHKEEQMFIAAEMCSDLHEMHEDKAV